MTTPIIDFVNDMNKNNKVRMFMPGHKGMRIIGCEEKDITEINGADELFAPTGIIAESEANASALFGCPTFYSTEGSSHCIRAMMYLATLYLKAQGKEPLVLATRNCHRSFISAAALIGFQPIWFNESKSDYFSTNISPISLKMFLDQSSFNPNVLYLTSPDYLGNILDIKGIAKVCHERGIILLVDNAHGAYLKFLNPSLHPIDLGADACCDSAHKTLPVLTGGAYLHISKKFEYMVERANDALALFASTSPSYLILQSLDANNYELENGFQDKIKVLIDKVLEYKQKLKQAGYDIVGNEPMKISICVKNYGYTGQDISRILSEKGIEVDFADNDYIVAMPSVYSKENDLELFEKVLVNIPRKEKLDSNIFKLKNIKTMMSPRDVAFSDNELLDVEMCEGRICAELSYSCPPAIAIVVAGEIITKEAIEQFHYYGITKSRVVKQKKS